MNDIGPTIVDTATINYAKATTHRHTPFDTGLATIFAVKAIVRQMTFQATKVRKCLADERDFEDIVFRSITFP